MRIDRTRTAEARLRRMNRRSLRRMKSAAALLILAFHAEG